MATEAEMRELVRVYEKVEAIVADVNQVGAPPVDAKALEEYIYSEYNPLFQQDWVKTRGVVALECNGQIDYTRKVIRANYLVFQPIVEAINRHDAKYRRPEVRILPL